MLKNYGGQQYYRLYSTSIVDIYLPWPGNFTSISRVVDTGMRCRYRSKILDADSYRCQKNIPLIENINLYVFSMLSNPS